MDRTEFLNGLHRVRLLALDIDGTILTNDKRLTDRTARAICAAIGKGVQAVLVTGRPLSGLPPQLAHLSGIRYAITSNGAVTTDLAEKRTLRASCLDAETAKRLARIPMERRLIHSVFLDGVGYCEPAFYTMLRAKYAGTAIEPYVAASRAQTDSIEKRIDECADGAENIWFIAHDTAERDALNAYILENFDVQTVLTDKTHVEIGARGADKGLALTALAERLGIERAQMLAIGDNENDLGMFRACGLCAAMGNATQGALAQADFVTDTNEADGAAKIMEWI